MSEENSEVYLPSDVKYYYEPVEGAQLKLKMGLELIGTYMTFAVATDGSSSGANADAAHRLAEEVVEHGDRLAEAEVVEVGGAISIELVGSDDTFAIISADSLISARCEFVQDGETGLIPASNFEGLEPWNPEDYRIADYTVLAI